MPIVRTQACLDNGPMPRLSADLSPRSYARIGGLLLDAGFHTVVVKRAPVFELWALALRDDADAEGIQQHLRQFGFDMTSEDS